ncbi:HNH endonuclease [Nocardioides sp.]|uniref:HNH endonuclease n=1 Tax=Nocardioides sp. TaxID=35761 RepID=UPI003D096E8B
MFEQSGDPSSSFPVSAAGLRGWAAALVGVDRAVDDGERVEQLAALEELKAAACAAQARVAVDFARSQEAVMRASGVPAARAGATVGVGVGAQVALARRESPHRGGRLLGLARVLVAEMPCTLRALETGLVNEWRATVIVRETACVTGEDRAAIDAELWADSTVVSALGDRALAATVKRLAHRCDPRAVLARAAQAETERCVSLRPAPDTMTYLTALLPMAQGVAAYAALTQAADTARSDGDVRGRGQVMADTLVQHLTGQTRASDVGVRVNLVMSDTTLLGDCTDPATTDPAADEPALISGHGPIPATVARRLVATASGSQRAWVRRLYQHHGRLIAMESRARRFPEAMGDFLDLRDQQCRTPWCDAPIRHHDHITAHTTGGPTAVTNGQGLCEACNHTKQTPGWQARPGPHGQVITTTPTRHHYTSPEPPPPGRPPPRQARRKAA